MLKTKSPPKSTTKGKFQPDKFFRFKNQTVRVWHNPNDGFWYDEECTAYGLTKADKGFNGPSAAGAGIFTLPSYFYRLNEAARFHDAAFSIPLFQAFHTRAEADQILEESVIYIAGKDLWSRIGYGLVGRWFRILASIFGTFLWENKKTR